MWRGLRKGRFGASCPSSRGGRYVQYGVGLCGGTRRSRAARATIGGSLQSLPRDSACMFHVENCLGREVAPVVLCTKMGVRYLTASEIMGAARVELSLL